MRQPHKSLDLKLNLLACVMLSLTAPPAVAVARGVPQTQEARPSAEATLAQAHQLNHKALALNRKGDFPAAIEKFKQASELFERAADYTGVAAMNTYISLAYQRLGDWAKTFDHALRARQAWLAASDRVGEVHALRLMGVASQMLGNYEESFVHLTDAVSRLDSPADRSLKADLLLQLGMFARTWGDEPKSVVYFQQSAALRQAIGPPAKEARVLVEMAQSYRMLGMNEAALEKSTDALRLLGEGGDPQLEALALYQQGGAYAGLGEDRKAADSLEQALRRAKETGDQLVQALSLRQLGIVYDALGDRRKALENLDRVVALSDAATDPVIKANLLTQAALSHTLLDKNRQALQYYGRALELFRATDNKLGVSVALAGSGLAQELLGDAQEASSLYDRAITAREEIRTSVRIEELRLSIDGQSLDVYQLAVHLSMRLRRFNRAFELSERARARNFLDQLANPRLDLRKSADPVLAGRERALLGAVRELEKRLREERARPLPQVSPGAVKSLESQLAGKRQEYAELSARMRALNPEGDSLRDVNPLTLPEVQRLLDENTTLVSYFVTHDKTMAFVITRGAFQGLEIPVGEAELNREVGLFHTSRGNLNDPQPRILRQLYDKLIVPLRPHIRTGVVGIIPHGVLHYLPFAALNDGQNYFGDRHTLFYLPSAGVIPFVQQKRKQGEQRLLALAYDRAESLPLLAYANQTAETVAKLYNTTAIIGSAATETAFRARAGTSRTLFLAAHGAMSKSSPLFSRIFLAPEGQNDGVLEVHEVYGLDLAKADLVVLSACQTQLGGHGRGDDIVGLNRAFIYAGSPTVVASLWSVQDKETGELMVAFFKHLKGGMSKAKALQAAQREMRARYPHPYYWAAFVLNGDPGQ